MTTTTNDATRIENSGPETVEAFGWQIQRGYVFRVVAADDSAWDCSAEYECEEEQRFGYHGNDLPPCGADYLYQGDGELLVIASESNPSEIDTVEGFTLEPVRLEEGDRYHDGTWGFCVLDVASDGETIIAGKC